MSTPQLEMCFGLHYKKRKKFWLCTQNLDGTKRPHLKDVFKQSIEVS